MHGSNFPSTKFLASFRFHFMIFDYYNFDNCTIDAPLDFKRPNPNNISTDLVLFGDSLTFGGIPKYDTVLAPCTPLRLKCKKSFVILAPPAHTHTRSIISLEVNTLRLQSWRSTVDPWLLHIPILSQKFPILFRWTVSSELSKIFHSRLGVEFVSACDFFRDIRPGQFNDICSKIRVLVFKYIFLIPCLFRVLTKSIVHDWNPSRKWKYELGSEGILTWNSRQRNCKDFFLLPNYSSRQFSDTGRAHSINPVKWHSTREVKEDYFTERYCDKDWRRIRIHRIRITAWRNHPSQ